MSINFIQFALMHLFGLLTPGPGFLIVIENSIIYNKTVAFITSVSLNLAYLIHVLIIIYLSYHEDIVMPNYLNNAFSITSSIVILYIAYKSYGKKNYFEISSSGKILSKMSKKDLMKISVASFFIGLFNSKGILMFSILLNNFANTSNIVYYGLWIPFFTILYHAVTINIFSNNKIRNIFIKKIKNVNKIFAFLLLLIAIKNLTKIKFYCST